MNGVLNMTNYERGIKKTLVKALNKTGYDMVKIFRKTIRQRYGLTVQGAVYITNTHITVEKATEQNLKVILKPSGRIIPLIFFNAVQNPSMPGTSVEIYRGKSQMLPHAFIPASRSGERYKSPKTGLAGVFKRIGNSSPQHITLQGGFPFKQMFMESIPEADKSMGQIFEKNYQKYHMQETQNA